MVAQIGKLRHKVALQRYTETRDEEGGSIRTFTLLANVWADINPLLGQEREIGDKQESLLTHRITIRYFGGLKVNDRIVFRGLAYNFIAIKDPGYRGCFMIIDAGLNEEATP